MEAQISRLDPCKEQGVGRVRIGVVALRTYEFASSSAAVIVDSMGGRVEGSAEGLSVLGVTHFYMVQRQILCDSEARSFDLTASSH